jgi:DNA polymerase III epsilon subunit-like protein
MTLKELNKNYHFEKSKLRQWLIDEKIIDKTDESDIYDLEVDEDLANKIKEHVYAIKDTKVRRKFQGIDEYVAPKMIPMPFRILNIDNFVVLDTETTGLYKDDEVIELSVIDERGRELYHSLFKPEKKMGEAALRVTGLDNPMLENEPLFKDEWPKIKKAVGKKKILGHNIGYDYRITLATAKRYGINENEVKALFRDYIDSKEIAKKYLRSRSYKLAYLCKKLGITESQKHRATYDCLQTLQMLRRLERKLLNEGATKDTDVYDERLEEQEEVLMEAIKEAVVAGYKANKSIEDLSIFYGLSLEETTDLIIEAAKKQGFVLRVDRDQEEAVLFIVRSYQNLPFEKLVKKVKKYANEQELKLILAKNEEVLS